MVAHEKYTNKANPHAWMQVAENLHEQAEILYKTKNEMIVYVEHTTGNREERYTANRAIYLLGAFALENALKSFLVYENPSWISNGRMSKKLKSHSLKSLKKKCVNVPYKRQYQWVLSSFEESIESWARYPCALNENETYDEGILSERLWTGYNKLINAYLKRLRELISKKWKGPHGYECSFLFIKYT